MSKIVVGAEGWAIDTTGGPHVSDVPETNAFYHFVETARAHNIISGHDTADRCAPQATPCFKPFDNVTRGQLSKIVVNAQLHHMRRPGLHWATKRPGRSPVRA